MRRPGLWIIVLAAVCGATAWGQDANRVAQLVSVVEARAAAFWPDSKVPASRAALFRDELAEARDAVDQMAALGETAIPGFDRLLRNKSAQCRANAAYGLSQIGGPEIVPALRAHMNDPSPAVRYQVALALGYSASQAALAALNELAGDDDMAVRNAAIQTGGVLRDILAAEALPAVAERVEALVKLAHSKIACARLVHYGADAVPALIGALDSEDRGVVSGAAEALAEIGDSRGLEPLWAHFEASLKATPELKFAQALAQLRSPEVWPYLVKLLGTDLAAAQAYALDRIGSVDNPDRLKTVHEYLQRLIAAGAHKETVRGPEREVDVVARTCRLLGKIGDASSLPLLEQVISEAPPAEKSIVRPVAEAAKAEIQKRAG